MNRRARELRSVPARRTLLMYPASKISKGYTSKGLGRPVKRGPYYIVIVFNDVFDVVFFFFFWLSTGIKKISFFSSVRTS